MLKKIDAFFDGLFNAVEIIPTGVYTYQADPDSELPYKLHLRVESDGCGILTINAKTVLHLNQTATELAFYLIDGEKPANIPALVAARYDVPVTEAKADMDAFLEKVDTLINTEDIDPVTYLDIDRVEPYSQKITAPYRLDCALTYQVSAGSDSSHAPTERVSKNLTTSEWKQALAKAYKAGIPHVVFTGGEPTLRDDLPELIEEAEDLGMVCGVLTDGVKCADKVYTQTLLQKGLDHIMLLCQPDNKAFWKALKVLMPEDIAVTVHVTIMHDDLAAVNALLEKLAKQGVRSLSLSADDAALTDALTAASQHAAELDMRLVWDMAVPYSAFNPVAAELRDAHKMIPDGAGKAWLYVEPDGDVLPAQGVNKVLGNLLTDPWEKIWKKH
jgi:organic radical activating enzyme